jgi:hypothetical protein
MKGRESIWKAPIVILEQLSHGKSEVLADVKRNVLQRELRRVGQAHNILGFSPPARQLSRRLRAPAAAGGPTSDSYHLQPVRGKRPGKFPAPAGIQQRLPLRIVSSQ